MLRIHSKSLKVNLSIHHELTLLIVFMMLTSSLLIGMFSYQTAKSELNRSGEVILKNGVKMVIEAINLKANAVELGIQDLSSAQEDIKQLILGPKQPDGTRPINKNIDLGENGYFFILNKDAFEIAHPSIEGQNTWMTKDMSGREFYVAQDIIQKALSGGGFTYYSWKWPYSSRIAPKVSYAEVDPHWNWIVVSSIYLEDYNRGASRIFGVLVLAFIITLCIGIILIYLISKRITNPITTIASKMKGFTWNPSDYIPIEVNTENEIGFLANAFNTMAKNLLDENIKRLASEQELIQLNEALEDRIKSRTDELMEVNRRLAESEKMAALTHLVFGIAHEVNTPLGNAISMGSYIESLVKQTESQLLGNQLSKSQLTSSLKEMDTSALLLNKSLFVTSRMIENFKQVSPNFQTNNLSWFNVKDTLRMMALSMSQELSDHDCQIKIKGSDSLSFYSYESDFLHLFSQLTNNSLSHGFNDSTQGLIEISFKTVTEYLEITYSDNGCGISQADLNRVFEPFFTTSRSQGNLGLGLFIVYNLVTQKLGGHIEIKNGISGGIHIKIRIPLITPK